MQALMDWLDRLREVGADDFRSTHQRLLVPGSKALFFDDWIIRCAPIGPIGAQPGQTPRAVSVLEWLDSGPINIEEQSALTQQIGALIAFATGRRTEVPYELTTSIETAPGRISFLPTTHIFDGRLFGPAPGDTKDRLSDTLGHLASLSLEERGPIGVAIELHYGALLLVDRDINAAYTLLVAGIEALSRAFGEPPENWSDWEDSPIWDDVFDDAALSDRQRSLIRDSLMADRQLRVTATFARYGSRRLRPSYWDGVWDLWIFPVEMKADGETNWMEVDQVAEVPVQQVIPRDRNVLRLALRRSYSARSGFVHEGDRLAVL